MKATGRISKAYVLTGLLAIAYIAIGTPLVHPFLHGQLNHDCVSEAHHDGFHRAESEGHDDPSCPICDFLAANPLRFWAADLQHVGDGRSGKLEIASPVASIKTDKRRDRSRAPPAA